MSKAYEFIHGQLSKKIGSPFYVLLQHGPQHVAPVYMPDWQDFYLSENPRLSVLLLGDEKTLRIHAGEMRPYKMEVQNGQPRRWHVCGDEIAYSLMQTPAFPAVEAATTLKRYKHPERWLMALQRRNHTAQASQPEAVRSLALAAG